MGDTVLEAKEEAMDGLKLFINHNKPENLPEVLKDEYKIIFHFDTNSILTYYKGLFTNTGPEKLTGINSKQLHHYTSGLKTPRQPQVKK